MSKLKNKPVLISVLAIIPLIATLLGCKKEKPVKVMYECGRRKVYFLNKLPDGGVQADSATLPIFCDRIELK